MSDRQMPAPITSPESRHFWEAAKERRFLLKRCADCGWRIWYPRAICPTCFSDDTRWEDAPTSGVVYAFTVMRRAKVPYTLAYVTLVDGPTMMTNIVDVDPDAVAIGMPVTLAFATALDGSLVPVFRPAEQGDAR